MRAWLWLLVGMVILGAGVARAQDAGAIERARGHMERGQSLYLEGRFEEAATEFEAAYAAQAFSAFLYNAGVALERAGQPERAAELFERYLAREPGAADANAVRQRIRVLHQAMRPTPPARGQAPAPAPTPTPPPATAAQEFKSLLSVRTNPVGATVSVRRGNEVVARGAGPFAHTLDQGRYRVTVEHPDFQTVSQDMTIEAGQVYFIIVEMSQGQFLGYLRVASNVPGARVFIDNREQGPRGQTPFEAPIPIGVHRIWVEHSGYESAESRAEVAIGADVTVRVNLERLSYGRLRVIANIAHARVFVDEDEAGEVPYQGRHSAGPHRVRVVSGGMKVYDTHVTIARGQVTPVRVTLRPDVDRSNAYVTAVFAAIFLAGGITTAVLGNDLMNQLTQARDAGTLASDDPRLDQGLFFWIAADGAFGVSAIFGILALYYFLYDPLPASEGRVLRARDWALSPFVDPVRGVAGLGATGRF